MSPGSATPATLPAPANPPAGGLAPERVIEIDADPERVRNEPVPDMTESRLAELASAIRLR